MNTENDYFVEVCDNCLRASCWHGDFMCEDAQNVGTKIMKASELRELSIEHESNFSRQKLLKVQGYVEYC
ncbi:MAG: hypothetical protein ACFFG0_41205 [Candidatus Thorarchaeota archaeon]